MNLFLLGAISMGCAVAALLFFRFWRRTGDRFFFYFGLAFLVEAANRAHFALSGARHEEAQLYYLIRLGSYGLILWAIIAKNLPRRGH
ncbi:MAG: DUF5985 family protein [Pseudomonas sp.]